MYEAWIPPREAKAVDWIPRHIVIPEETETPGLFSLDLFPHVRGVLEAIDDPMIRNIYLPWATRAAKTTTALAALIFFGCNSPRPMMFGSNNEEKADETIQAQLYPMLEACELTRRQLLPEHRRNKRYVRLDRCRIRRSFSGSPSTMAGFPACYAVASEASKWTTKKSTEAPALKLFAKRGRLYPFESKYIYESSPGTQGECQITALTSAPTTDRRYYHVPCPHCGQFQRLDLGDRDSNFGLKWEKNAAGRSEILRAEETAYYQCRHCQGKIENLHRPAMMRRGVWVPEGQTLDARGTLHGTPRIVSPDVAFCDLSALYALATSGWGQVAGEFLRAVHSPDRREALRDFENSVMGRVWDPAPLTTHPHELAERLCDPDTTAGLVPPWGKIMTCGIDVQDHGQTFVYVAAAWGDGGRGHEVSHGVCTSFDDLMKDVLLAAWLHADGGERMALSFRLMDSGDESETVYALARQIRGMLAAKGMSKPFNAEYREVVLPAHRRRNRSARGDVHLIEINTDWTQKWLQKRIDGEAQPYEPAFTLSKESALDLDFLDQLLNEQRVEEIDARGYPQISWRRRTSGPNDYRDCLRLAKVAASYLTNHGKNWDKLPGRNPLAARRETPRPRLTTPDGRPYLITERQP